MLPPDPTPLAIPKYAKLEMERRFLVDADVVDKLGGRSHRRIEDLYIDGGRLRLRAITYSQSDEREFKLCKKYPSGDVLVGPVTNLYLTAEEHAAFRFMKGALILKRRYAVDGFGINVFEGNLSGLVLAEIESNDRDALMGVARPDGCIREVTDELFFTGGSLCRLSSAELAAALA